jgi:hypothetical protein
MAEEDQKSWRKFKEIMSMVFDSGDHAKTARHKLDGVIMTGTLDEYTQEVMSLLGDVATVILFLRKIKSIFIRKA